MLKEELKNKFPIGTHFKCLKILNVTTLEEELWNKMVNRGITHEVTGYVKNNNNEKITFITKIINYDPDQFFADKEFLERNHFFIVTIDRLNLLSIIKNTSTCNSSAYPHTCQKCGAPAYIGLLNTDCSKKCS